MTLKPNVAAEGHTRADAAQNDAPLASGEPFVLNLCSSTTPMALAHPEAQELKRFSFFVSRRLEDGRERFRLHMGYFATLAEAEEWLNVVRDIYPGAWAGEAPGKRLRARLPNADSVAPNIPTLEPPPELPSAAAHTAAPVVAPKTAPPITAIAAAAVVGTTVAKPASARLASAAVIPAASMAAAARVAAASAPKVPPVPEARKPLSNVREVMASLDETAETRQMPAPMRTTAPAAASRPAASSGASRDALTDTQVLKILEERRPQHTPRENAEPNGGIALLKPDDTGTRRALKEAVQQNAPVAFAVQLQWAVQPVALDKVPPLAIFSAYTLYTVEGSREGRKWYGLRLGFFTDAISAKQVAHYVRSEFTSVAVVPVSPQERGRATVADHTAPRTSFAEPSREAPRDEIKLIDEPVATPPVRTSAPAPSSRAAAKVARGAAKTATAQARSAASRGKKTPGKVRASEKSSPHTMEETLEILGAGNLEIDNGRGELINDSGVRHLRVEVQKNSPFSRLLDRLAERVRKA